MLVMLIAIRIINPNGPGTNLEPSFAEPSMPLHPLKSWTNDLFLTNDLAPRGWKIGGTNSTGKLGTIAHYLWFEMPTARNLSWVSFSEQLAIYPTVNDAIKGYEQWMQATIPPTYQNDWKQEPELEYESSADDLIIRCLPGYIDQLSNLACVEVARYQNVIVLVRGNVFDNQWLTISNFHDVLTAIDQRIIAVLSAP